MNRTIEQWSGCQPEAMATEQSDVARTFAFADAKADILELHRENERLRDLLADLKAWDVEQYLTIPHELRERIQRELTHNAMEAPQGQKDKNEQRTNDCRTSGIA